jgi:hypothetical protein
LSVSVSCALLLGVHLARFTKFNAVTSINVVASGFSLVNSSLFVELLTKSSIFYSKLLGELFTFRLIRISLRILSGPDFKISDGANNDQ